MLRTFQVVAQELNITRAAARLHLTQQAVSAQIRQLERSIAVPLLDRTSRGVLLTPAGSELATGAKQILGDLDALVSRVRRTGQEPADRLRVACCPYATALFATEMAEMLETGMPGLQVELRNVRSPRAELELLRSGAADAAVMWLPIGDVGLRHAVVRRDRVLVAVGRGHRMAAHDSVTLADLADEPVPIPDVHVSAAAEAGWLLDPRPDGRPARRGPVVPDIEDCLLLIGRGHGVWFAPEPLARWIPAGTVRWLPIEDAEPMELAVVWPAQAPESLIRDMVAEVRLCTGWIEP